MNHSDNEYKSFIILLSIFVNSITIVLVLANKIIGVFGLFVPAGVLALVQLGLAWPKVFFWEGEQAFQSFFVIISRFILASFIAYVIKPFLQLGFFLSL